MISGLGAWLSTLPVEATGHVDPSTQIALWLALILIAAKLGGDLATRLGQPAVLGGLLASIVVGNLHLVGKQVWAFGVIGLVFASIGAALVVGSEQVIDATTYSAVVAMVIVTTLVTPPLIKWRLAQLEGSR